VKIYPIGALLKFQQVTCELERAKSAKILEYVRKLGLLFWVGVFLFLNVFSFNPFVLLNDVFIHE